MKEISLFKHQNDSVDGAYRSWSAGNTNVLVVLPTGAGKCLGHGTPVLMYDGTIKEVQDVNAGDLLMGTDSTPRKVKSTIAGQEMLYRVTPVKGDPYVVNESHILSLKQTGLKSLPKYNSQKDKGDIVNITVKEYLTKSKTFKHTHKGWRTSVSWSESELPDLLPPYLLGVWLGDGSTDQPEITSADIEIVKYLTEYCNHHGFELSKRVQPNNASSVYRITNCGKRLTGLIPIMRAYNLLGYKHIPHVYKTGSDNQRLEVLAGILDSDGHLTKGYYDITLKSEELLDDVIFIARSLGFAAHKKQCQKTCTNTGATGTYYRTSISGDVSRIPTKLARHQPAPRKQKKSVLVTGIKVEPIGVGDYYGFDISGDRLFMLGDFTVTHNTLVKAEIAKRCRDNNEPCIIFAHRDVLLGQISDALCLMKVTHSFIASKPTVTNITNINLTCYYNSYYSETSTVIVSSVDAFLARMKKGQVEHLAKIIKRWMLDEAHHLLEGNKWGQCIETLSNAKGLGVTATPLRADNKGLGRNSDGVFDDMIVGSSMVELINIGRLSPYKIYAPPSRLDIKGMGVTSSGDYNQKELAARTDTTAITGDAVEHYLRIANGLQAITYCVNIAHSEHVADQFNKAGVPSIALSSKTPTKIRQKAIADFKAGNILNLVNSDLFGEGFDVPAVVVGIMLRKTQSYSLFKQQFGRPLRVLEGKPYGIIIDHVNNVQDMMVKYKLNYPHEDPEWTLERPIKRRTNGDGESIPSGRVCPECAAFYIPSQPSVKVCPECNHEETVAESNAAQQDFQAREGKLVEMEIGFINQLILEREKIDRPVEMVRSEMIYATPVVRNSVVNNHVKRQYAQNILRDYMQKWCADMATVNQWDAKTVQQEFEIQFNINILKAQVLSERQTLELTEKIKNEYY